MHSKKCLPPHFVAIDDKHNHLKKKTQNEWLFPEIVTKLIEAGQHKYRNT